MPSTNITTALFKAIESHDIAAIEQYLPQVDVNNSRDLYRKETLLQVAVRTGYTDVVKLLLNHGADIEAKGDYERTALHEASGRGHVEVVQLLLGRGADSEVRDRFGTPALHEAAWRGHVRVVQLLLDRGAESQAESSRGTALHAAAANGHVEVVRLLLDRGAYIEAKDSFERTVLENAALKGHVEVIRLLLDRRADIEAKDRFERTALHAAASKGHVQVVQLLLDQGANIEAKDKFNRSALEYAIEYNSPNKSAITLLNNGAKLAVSGVPNGNANALLAYISRKCPLMAVYCLTAKRTPFNIAAHEVEPLLHQAVDQYSAQANIQDEKIPYVKYQLLGFFRDPQFGHPFFNSLFPETDSFQNLSNSQKIVIAYCLHTPFKELKQQLSQYQRTQLITEKVITAIQTGIEKAMQRRLPQELIDKIAAFAFPSMHPNPECFSHLPLYLLYEAKDLNQAYQVLLGQFRDKITDNTLEATYNTLQAACREQAAHFLQQDTQAVEPPYAALQM